MKKSKLVLTGIAILMCSILELAQQNNIVNTNCKAQTNNSSQGKLPEDNDEVPMVVPAVGCRLGFY
jgi:hypothetical protein